MGARRAAALGLAVWLAAAGAAAQPAPASENARIAAALALRVQQRDAEALTLLTAVCLMLFSLVHNPWSTTIFTIWKETRSVKWTTLSALLPVVMGFLLCFVVAQSWRLVAG